MNIERLREIIACLEGTNVSEFEWKEGESHIRVVRATVVAVAAPISAPPPAPAPISEPSPAPSPIENLEALGHVVRSPMVGTFYRASSPGAKPFIDVGSRVKKGDVLCIVEAMKLMNHIEAEVGGMVAKILVENGEPVEYGQPLFVIAAG